ncbi:ras-related protein Rab-22A-like [Diadema setosum]|uniref:ras-related protein Rab-22A-like n=1 Tax=Diadema setosum TaxID=31175 RepID=UPI003B3A3E16
MTTSKEDIVKVCLLGKYGVGKTSLATRFISGTFRKSCQATVGAAFLTKIICYGNREYCMALWDTSGDEKFRAVAALTYRRAAAALVVYDITEKKSFDDVEYWMNELRKKAPEDILIFVIGNKLDLESQRAVSRSSAEQYAKENDAVHLEASAKTGEGISEIFHEICATLSKVSQDKNSGYLDHREKGTTIHLGSSLNDQHGVGGDTARGCRCRTH